MFDDLHIAAPARQDDTLSESAGFSAATPCGQARLHLRTGARHAVDAAIALQRCDELLCALQAWANLPLAWRWDGHDPTLASAASVARAKTPHGTLALPWALLRTLPAPDAALAAQLDWADTPAVLAVSRLALPADELALLETGGAVVLPDSQAPAWRGTLRAAGEPANAGVPVILPSPDAPVLAARGAATPQPTHDERHTACEVRLSLAHPVAAGHLAGWHDGQSLLTASQAGLWRCTPAQALATGRLMPWGEGWALRIEALA